MAICFRLFLTALLLTTALRPAAAQTTAQTTHPAPIPHTISVAGLRISQPAWDHFNKAAAALATRNEDDFNREFATALQIEPNFGALYLLRASHLVHLHQPEAAIQDVLSAQRIEPRIVSAGTILAGAYNALHRYSDAAIILENLHGSEASTWQAIYELTRTATGRNQVQEGLRLSALTLKLAPDTCLEAHLLRANALHLAQRYAETVIELKRYIALQDPGRPRPDVLTMIELNQRQANEAPPAQVASR